MKELVRIPPKVLMTINSIALRLHIHLIITTLAPLDFSPMMLFIGRQGPSELRVTDIRKQYIFYNCIGKQRIEKHLERL